MPLSAGCASRPERTTVKTKTTKLWIANTSWVPDYEAYVLCRTALESVERSLTPGEILHPIKVKLTNCSWAFRGRAHWWERDRKEPTKRWCRVLVRIGKPHHFPKDWTYWKFKNMPEFRHETYREGLVAVTAHEIAHTLGYSGRKAGEEKCEMCAWDAIDYYRKHREEIDAEIARYASVVTEREVRASRKPTQEEVAIKKYMQIQAKLTQWQRRLKVATNKVKKYTRAMKRAEKRLQPVPEALPLAATSSTEPQTTQTAEPKG